jgi:probable F420-dependent oxidoreductase
VTAGGRLGLSVPLDVPLRELPALARRAEELGYTDAWSMESNGLDGFTPLAAAAAVTERMRLGTAIIPAWTRPAGLLAMHAAALAELAPGRFVLGLGSSTPVVVEQWLGVPFSRPLSRTREAALAVRALLAGERVGGMRLARPPREQTVAIYVAALGPRMLRMAGEVASGVVFYLVGPRLMPQLLADVGREVDSVARLAVFAGEGAEARAAARRSLLSYILVPYYARSLTRQGFGEEVAAAGEAWRTGDRAGAAGQVSDAMLDELLLIGAPDRIADRLQAYRAAGLRTPVLAFASLGSDPGARLAETSRLIELLSALR